MVYLNALPGAIGQALIWGIMAIGLFISYKILDFADLTVDGSMVTGAGTCAVLLANDVPTGVAISEAVRLAKKYDGDDTGSFVNGILGSFARGLQTEEV